MQVLYGQVSQTVRLLAERGTHILDICVVWSSSGDGSRATSGSRLAFPNFDPFLMLMTTPPRYRDQEMSDSMRWKTELIASLRTLS
jgi:hypothetical protein